MEKPIINNNEMAGNETITKDAWALFDIINKQLPFDKIGEKFKYNTMLCLIDSLIEATEAKDIKQVKMKLYERIKNGYIRMQENRKRYMLKGLSLEEEPEDETSEKRTVGRVLKYIKNKLPSNKAETVSKDARKIFEYIKNKFPFDKVGKGFKNDVMLCLIGSLLEEVDKKEAEQKELILNKLMDKLHGILKEYMDGEKEKTEIELANRFGKN